ncbi:MAG: transketolase [Methylovirgula sp.]
MNQSFDPASLRQTILDMAYSGSSVHVACAFSIVEILAVLYGKHLRYPDGRSDHPLRDYLVLSKGHGIMAQYACLLEMGWIGPDELANYFKNGTRLHGLSEVGIPGVEVTSGSLGHGLSVGTGLALAAKRRNSDQMCYAIIGDGEANEGSIWEAMLFASQLKLDNFIVIIDKNDFQAMGPTADILAPGDLVAKFEAFGFDAALVDGHDEAILHSGLSAFEAEKNGRPKGIIARTVKGKGISFMENNNVWHYTRLDSETYAAASRELRSSTK